MSERAKRAGLVADWKLRQVSVAVLPALIIALQASTIVAQATRPEWVKTSMDLMQAAGRANSDGDRALALRLYREVLEKVPWSDHVPEAQYQVGHILLKQHQFTTALAEHEKFMRANYIPQDHYASVMLKNFRHDALVDLAECHERIGEFDQALGCLALARDKFPYSSWCGTCMELAKKHIEQRRLEIILQRDAAR